MPEQECDRPRRSVFGDLPALRRDPLGFLTHCADTDAGIVRLRLPMKTAYLVLDPAEIERVLVADHRQFGKPLWLRSPAVRRLLGDGLVTSDGAKWREQRRVCGGAFRPGCIDAYGPVMASLAEQAVDRWRPGQMLDLSHEMARLTLEIVAQTLLRAELGDQANEINALMDTLMACFASGYSLFGLLPLPPTPRETRAVRQMDRLVDALIHRGRAALGEPRDDPSHPPTLLSLLIAGGMGKAQVREQVKTFLAAGYESSALALNWAFLMLARHPEADARLASELARVVGNRPLTPADAARLPYAQAVLRETLRLYPPLWMTGREALRRCEIGGISVPRGTLLMTSQWAVQRSARFFPDPEAFRPERWETVETANLPRFAYFPFGGGPRVCIGQGFAMTEMTLILAAVARRFRLDLDPSIALKPWATMTLRPPSGLLLRAEPRRQRHAAHALERSMTGVVTSVSPEAPFEGY